MAALSKLSALLAWDPPSWLKLAILGLCLLNIKSFPLAWHFRFYRTLGYHFLYRRHVQPKPQHLFSPLLTTSRSPPYECDLNGHKSNSTYFSDLDIARTHLVCHLTKASFALRSRQKQPVMYVALAGVLALFRKEIKPGQAYAISSRILAWDGKWLFVVSHFVDPKPCKNGETRRVYASSLSKYVFKSGRMTVPPETVLSESGLLPKKPEGAAGASVHASGASTPAGITELGGSEGMRRAEKVVMDDVDRALESETAEWSGWGWKRIEEERQRGLELARLMMGLDALHDEFREGDEAGLDKIGSFF